MKCPLLTAESLCSSLCGMQRPGAIGTNLAVSSPTAGDLATLRVRKLVTQVEEVQLEAGQRPEVPALRASVAAVLDNPWLATPPDTDLGADVVRIAPSLARSLTDRLLALLGGQEEIEAFGKAALVGSAGELEHGAALIHTPYFGNLMRTFLGGESIICFADMRCEAGESITVPMWHKTAAATRTHYQTVTARVADAPRANEIVVIAAAATGPRPHPRIGDRTTDPAVVVKEKNS